MALTRYHSIFIFPLKRKERIRKVSLELLKVKFTIISENLHILVSFLATTTILKLRLSILRLLML